MDYTSILETAYHNSQHKMKKKDVEYYSTKFKPIKKDEKSKKLSENVQKFLMKQKEKEMHERLEAQKRKQSIEEKKQEIRKKRPRKFVTKNIKEIDKSMILSTGLDEPDEDDYGYVSQEASDFHKKLLERYKNVSVASNNLSPNSIKKSCDNIKLKLKNSKEKTNSEDLKINSTKVTTDTNNNDTKNCNSNSHTKKINVKSETKSVKIVKHIPPQMSFQDLLKLAQQKQFEPIIIEKKVVEERRPMTQKQFEEYRMEQESKRRREQKWLDLEKKDAKKFAKSNQIVNNNIKKVTVPSISTQNTVQSSKSQPKKSEIKKISNSKTINKSIVKSNPKVANVNIKKETFKRKHDVIYSDEEYDSEMDDFIDDSYDNSEDVSNVIKEIFKYDKSKYKDENDADIIESSFRDQMREEMMSTKIGIMEDLEDIQKEHEDRLKKKQQLKKKR